MNYSLITFSSYVLLIACASYVDALDRTETVASRKRFPEFIIDLRNKTNHFLTEASIRMKLDEQELQRSGHEFHAQHLENLSSEAYEVLEKRIDDVFQKIDDEFIRISEYLDDSEASVKQKALFIDRLQKKAHLLVDDVIKKNSMLMRDNPLNVDI